ncbi:MAG: hypothetical protein SNJ77_03425 [Cytophagales bacterium]
MFKSYFTQKYFLDTSDFVLTPLYFLFFFILLQFLAKTQKKENQAYFIKAGIAKLVAAIFFSLIYYAVYGGGDTSQYFTFGKRINISFFEESPTFFFKILFSHGQFDSETEILTRYMDWYSDKSSFLIVKIVSVLCFFSFQTFIPIAMFFAFFSFLGLWKLFLIFSEENPLHKKHIWLAIFFVPSTLFWSSGILKDGIVLAALCFSFCGFYEFYKKGKFSFKNIFYFVAGAYIVYYIKSYVLACFLSMFLIPLTHSQLVSKKRSLVFKFLVVLVSFFTLAIVIYQMVNSASWQKELEELSENIAISANYLYYMSELSQGSGYTLGELDGSIQSVLSKIHLAVFTTLYRPFIWESKNATMLLSAIESTFMIILTLYIIFFANKKYILYRFRSDGFFISTLLTTIVFGTLVGLSSYNFGTLVRYKIPILPFLVTMLFLCIKKKQKSVIKKPHITSEFQEK